MHRRRVQAREQALAHARSIVDITDLPVSADLVKGFQIAKGEYVLLDKEDLDSVKLESTHTIDIEKFVPRTGIDHLYWDVPYHLLPNGKTGVEAFAVIREAINEKGMEAIGKVVFTSREHMSALEARGKGLMGVTLRYPYECSDTKVETLRAAEILFNGIDCGAFSKLLLQ